MFKFLVKVVELNVHEYLLNIWIDLVDYLVIVSRHWSEALRIIPTKREETLVKAIHF